MVGSSDEEEAFVRCEICNLPFSGIQPFEQHLKGKKHQKQKKRNMGKKSLNDGGEAIGLEGTKDEDAESYKCDICETTCSGIVSYKQHLRSNPHAKAIRRKKAEEDPTKYDDATSISELPDDDVDLNELVKEIIPDPFASCSICEKDFTGPESYHQHLKSKSHSKRKYQLLILLKIKSDLKKYNELSEANESGEVQPGEKGLALSDEHAELECQECHKSFSGAISLAQHLVSKVHTKRQNRNKLLEELNNLRTLDLEDDSTSEDPQSGERQDDDGALDSVLTCDVCTMAFSGPESANAHFRSKGHQKALRWRKYLDQKRKLAKQSGDTETDLAVKNDEIAIENDEVKSESVEVKADDDKDRGRELDSDTADRHVLTQENSASESSSDDNDDGEKCPSYHEVEKQVPSENVDQKNPGDFVSSGEDKNPQSLYPILPTDDDDDDQKTPEYPEKDRHKSFSESESVEFEDENAVPTSKESKEKKNKTAICKSGVGKIVRSMVKALD